MEANNDEEIQKIEQDIRLSGFPLEIEVSSVLQKDGWHVRNQVFYIDDEEGKTRTVDVIAHKAFFEKIGDYDRLNMTLVIECKKSEKPWVFFTTPRIDPGPVDLELLGSIKQFAKPDIIKSLAFAKWLRSESHCSYDKRKEYAVISYEPFKKGKGREILEAIYQVTKALNFQLAEFTKNASLFSMNPVILLYPIVVLDGHLYESRPRTEDMGVRRCGSLQFSVSRKTPFLVDILEKDYLPQFLTAINNDITSLKDFLRAR